ncbi:MAG: hypothetical protein LBI33_00920 [Propionibacteriaceae bacterium]|jgi:DNA-binding MarR family transcriptional regulator|nr:hypothetical protein [Propionibacteriaceae bacterium]
MTVVPVYTPSLLPGEALERLFVGREPILADAAARIGDAVESGRLTHTLFIGPTGSGKTHLLALVHHRALGLPEFATQFRLVWLREEPSAIRSYDALLRAIEAGAGHGPPEGPRLTVVLIENLEDILHRIGTAGQHKLRARIESERDLLFIGTATQATRDLRDQTAPFYGFFHAVALEPLGIDQALALLARIAETADDTTTLALLRADPDLVRRRLTAINALADGQPGTWTRLAAGVSMADRDTFIEELTSRFDQMGPLYQERLHRLSANEQSVVTCLIAADHPLATKSMAEMTGVSPQSLSTAVRDLVRRGWIQRVTGRLAALADKRLAFYELADRFARIALKIKESGRVPLAVGVVAAWYDQCGPAGTRPGVSANPEAVGSWLEVDAALADVQSGSPYQVLGLPSSVIDVLEQALATRSVTAIRLDILLLAAEAGAGQDCVDRALDALAGLDDDELAAARPRVSQIRLAAGQTAPGGAPPGVEVVTPADQPGRTRGRSVGAGS